MTAAIETSCLNKIDNGATAGTGPYPDSGSATNLCHIDCANRGGSVDMGVLWFEAAVPLTRSRCCFLQGCATTQQDCASALRASMGKHARCSPRWHAIKHKASHSFSFQLFLAPCCSVHAYHIKSTNDAMYTTTHGEGVCAISS